MRFRVPSRSLILAFTLIIGVGAVTLASPARAKGVRPPFEITFPQETMKTQFRSTFGDRRSGGRRHKGNDLLAPRMTEVYAIADGIITHVGINRLSGRNVKIKHADGWSSYYIHLNNDHLGTDDGDAPWTLTVAPGVEEGMRVKAGQLIGWVGDSGNAEHTTTHTHFELRHDGRAINPYDLLTQAYQRDLLQEEDLVAEIVEDMGHYEIE